MTLCFSTKSTPLRHITRVSGLCAQCSLNPALVTTGVESVLRFRDTAYRVCGARSAEEAYFRGRRRREGNFPADMWWRCLGWASH